MQNFLQRMYIAEFIEVGNKWLNCGDFLLNVIREERFFLHPYLSKEAGKYLLANGINTVAIDAINIDKTGGTEFPIHDMYADASGLIAENLAHFDEIDFVDPFVVFLPLKLVGVDGSPVRAVAVEFE